MKSILRLFLFLCCLMSLGHPAAAAESAAAAPPAGPPRLTATAAIVIEAETGRVLYAKKAEERRFPASTTKMTALLVALENGDPNDIVAVSPRAAAMEGSSLGLAAGDRLRLLDLWYGMMLVSGNDAATAIAEHTAGSVGRFAWLMTRKARSIGAVHTHFVNACGLPDAQHYSTAHDLARIAAYGLQQPMFARIVGAKSRTIRWLGGGRRQTIANTNHLLWLYPGAIGVKTGYTRAAGECLVAAADRGGVRLIGVVLHCDAGRRWAEMKALLDYGFRQITPATVFYKNSPVKTVRVHNGRPFRVALLAAAPVVLPFGGDAGKFSVAIDAPDLLAAPLPAGSPAGVVRVFYGQKEIKTVRLVTAAAVDSGFDLISWLAGWYDSLYLAWRQWTANA